MSVKDQLREMAEEGAEQEHASRERTYIEIKLPKTLGEGVDRLRALRDERLSVEKRAEALRAEYASLEHFIIGELKAQKSTGTKGMRAQATMKDKTVVQLEDDAKFFAYVTRTKGWDLVRKQVNEKAWRERIANGKQVPGVRTFTFPKLSVTAISPKRGAASAGKKRKGK